MGSVNTRDMINNPKYTEQDIINYINKYPLDCNLPNPDYISYNTELHTACSKRYQRLAIKILSQDTMNYDYLMLHYKTCNSAFHKACDNKLEEVVIKIFELIISWNRLSALTEYDNLNNTMLMEVCQRGLKFTANKLLDILPISVIHFKELDHNDALMVSVHNPDLIDFSRRILKTMSLDYLLSDNYGYELLSRCMYNTELAKDLINLLPNTGLFGKNNIFLNACDKNIDIAIYIYQRNMTIDLNYFYKNGSIGYMVDGNNALFILFDSPPSSWLVQSYKKSSPEIRDKKEKLAINLIQLIQEKDFHLLEHVDKDGRNILMHLIYHEVHDVASFLLNYIISLNKPEKSSNLSIKTMKENRLIEYLSCKDNEGHTALILCSINKNEDLALKLIEQSKNRQMVYMCDNSNLAVMDYACKYNKYRIIWVILEKFQDIEQVFQINKYTTRYSEYEIDRYKHIDNSELIDLIQRLYIKTCSTIIHSYPFYDVTKLNTNDCHKFFMNNRVQIFNFLTSIKATILNTSINITSTSGNCMVCSSNASTIVLIPCGHICLCVSCSNSIQELLICPVCNLNITHRYQTYKT